MDQSPAEPDASTTVAARPPARKPRARKPAAERQKPKETALSIRGLVKRFDSRIAVAGIDLEVPAGTLYGIVGPNGAGKTTTLSMVTGLLKPDAGSVAVHGTDV